MDTLRNQESTEMKLQLQMELQTTHIIGIIMKQLQVFQIYILVFTK